MNYAWKCTRLDFLLLKPYVKSIMVVFLAPLLMPVFTDSLFQGLSVAVMVMAMTTAYTFSVAEKNDLFRFYGFLPAKRKSFVIGRYIAVLAMGFTALLFSTAAQVVILSIRENEPDRGEIAAAYLISAILLCVYVCVQIPGYYRYGTIKGKVFMFIPTAGCLLLSLMIPEGNHSGRNLQVWPKPAVLAAGAVLLCAVFVLLSVSLSIKIVEKNRS